MSFLLSDKRMQSTCLLRQRGRSMFWKHLGRSTGEPSKKSLRLTGTLDRCTLGFLSWLQTCLWLNVSFTKSSNGRQNLKAFLLPQYDDDVLDICLKILDYDCRLILNPEEQQQSCRKDPVNVSRLLSAMVGLGSAFISRLADFCCPERCSC